MQAEGGIYETVTVTGFIFLLRMYALGLLSCWSEMVLHADVVSVLDFLFVCAAFVLVQYCWHWAVDVCQLPIAYSSLTEQAKWCLHMSLLHIEGLSGTIKYTCLVS